MILGIFLVISTVISHSLSGIVQQLSRNSQGEYPYSTITVTFYIEIFKLIFSAIIFSFVAYGDNDRTKKVSVKYLFLWFISALFEALANNIYYLAIKYLNSAILAEILTSVEIIVVGVGCHFFLGKKLQRIQWISLVLLSIGVVSAQISSCEKCSRFSDYPLNGSIYGLISGVCAGIGSLFFEYLLKYDEEMSIWQQNCYSFFFGSISNFIGIFIYEKDNIHQLVNKNNFTIYTLLIMLLYGYLGIIFSATLKNLNNIVKVFATSSSLFLTTILSSFLFGFEMTIPFALSLINVSVAIYLYQNEDEETQYARIPNSPEFQQSPQLSVDLSAPSETLHLLPQDEEI